MDFNGKSILITGGTGSFGKMLVRTLLKKNTPKRLIVFSRDELKQSEMSQEFDHPSMRYFLGDIRDRSRLLRAFHGVDYVIHAAALKQVPSGEYNPYEVVQTNVMGAQNVIDAAIDAGVQRVMALSTDKAANPINLYGATKLCSDKLFVAGNSYAAADRTRFSVVRYGNVINSRGSVIPHFKKLRESGTLPITDSRMTRFWITLEQGVEFVLQCLEVMHGGEVFIPKIPSMNLVDLAQVIAPNCKHDFIGIRPGEKLHETMIPQDEARNTVEFERYYVIKPAFASWVTGPAWAAGKPVSDRFQYSSDSNPWRLTHDELRKMVEA